ncbi:MAG: Flp pilus assembly protein CpaB [Bacillota bacterium]
MKLNNWTIFIIALLLAAGAAGYTYYYISHSQPKQETMVPVLTVVKEIPYNTVVTPEMVTVIRIPQQYAHPQALRAPADAAGKITKVVLLKDEIILSNKIAVKEQPNRFSYKVPPKQRAITLAVSEITGVAGFPTVGDRLDILLTKENDNGTQTSTMLQNKEVLATGAVSISQEDGTQRLVPSVTLMATPLEAENLTLAESTGKMKFTLRSPVDKEIVTLAPVSSK